MRAAAIVADKDYVILVRQRLQSGRYVCVLPSVAVADSTSTTSVCQSAREAFVSTVVKLPTSMSNDPLSVWEHPLCQYAIFHSQMALPRLRRFLETHACHELELLPWTSLISRSADIDFGVYMALRGLAKRCGYNLKPYVLNSGLEWSPPSIILFPPEWRHGAEPPPHPPLMIPSAPSRAADQSQRQLTLSPHPSDQSLRQPDQSSQQSDQSPHQSGQSLRQPDQTVRQPDQSTDLSTNQLDHWRRDPPCDAPRPCKAPNEREALTALAVLRDINGVTHVLSVAGPYGYGPPVADYRYRSPHEAAREMAAELFTHAPRRRLLECLRATPHAFFARHIDTTAAVCVARVHDVVPAYPALWTWVRADSIAAHWGPPAVRRALTAAVLGSVVTVLRCAQRRVPPLHVACAAAVAVSRSPMPCFDPLRADVTSVAAAAVKELATTVSGDDASFDRGRLRVLTEASRSRARSRGSRVVTDRDVRDAAQAILSGNPQGPVPSPADVIPPHFEYMRDLLDTLREAVQQTKVGGGESRAPRVLIVGETEPSHLALAFKWAGADVATCDLSPSNTIDIPHFRGDAKFIQDQGWDIVIGHPPCTYLSNAGAQYVYTEEGRVDRVREAAAVFRRMWNAKAPFVVLEQPKMHPLARQLVGEMRATQYVHPWQHGTGHTKPTGLYLSEKEGRRLPELRPTYPVPERSHALANLSPGPNRGAIRSRTYWGIALAMSTQWMPELIKYALEQPLERKTATQMVEDARKHSQTCAAVAVHLENVHDTLPPVIEAEGQLPTTQIAAATPFRPWTLPPTRVTIPPHRTTRVHHRHGRWSALQRTSSKGRYEWQPLNAELQERMQNLADDMKPNLNEPSFLEKIRKDSAVKWRQSAEGIFKSMAGCTPDEALNGGGPKKFLHHVDDPPANTMPNPKTAAELRAAHQRFVKETKPRVAATAASANWSDGIQMHSELRGSFDPEDIVINPKAKMKLPNCAYIRSFVVARRAQTRNKKDSFYRIDTALCSIDEAISDSGCGPSLIGSLLLADMPADACVKYEHNPEVEDGVVGADGKPLMMRGYVTILFTLSGVPFSHRFRVLEGGNLLLLGNDFNCKHGAKMEFDSRGTGSLKMDVSTPKSPEPKELSIPLTCGPRTSAAAAVIASRNCSQVAASASLTGVQPEEDPTSETPVIEVGEVIPPALVPLGVNDETASTAPFPETAPTADALLHTTMQSEDFLLHSINPIAINARTETTIWLPAPEAHRLRVSLMLVDRLPHRLGLDPVCGVACSLSPLDEKGRIPVRLINVQHKKITIPANHPIARLVVDYEVQVADPININSDDPYERLSAPQRALIDSVTVDPDEILTPEQRRRVRTLLAHHVRVFAMNPKDPTHTHLMKVDLPLKEGAVPHRHPPSRLGDSGSEIVEKHCAEMEANGIIRKSNGAWSSRIVLVKKKGGEIRFCIDFRDTNKKLQTLDSPIPRCDEAIDRLASGAGPHDSLFLSTLDLASGFWTLPIEEASKPITGFSTRRQRYEWNYLPFGIQSGPSYMCRLMDAALQGLAWEICIPYLDDVGVWSTGVGSTKEIRESASFEQMMTRLNLVLERMTWSGLSAKASKCILFATSTHYLGHIISRRGLEMDPAKVSRIRDIDPKLINTLERVRSFVGLCSYYRKFVSGFAKITAPLTDLTKTGVDVAVRSQSAECQKAITTLIEAMTTEPVILRMPRSDRPFILKTDGAATEGIGGVLSQTDDDGNERVVSYFSRRLNAHERNYTVTEIELLAAVESIKNWRSYLWNKRFTLVTDHSALKWLHSMKDTIEGGPSSRLMRWNLKLMEYQFDIEHKPGKLHLDADALSRLTDTVKTRIAAAVAKGPQNKRYRDENGQAHSAKVAFYCRSTDQVYSWIRNDRGKGIDLPGGQRDVGDNTIADTALRECEEEVILPLTVRNRLAYVVHNYDPVQECYQADSSLLHAWAVPVSEEEMKGIKQTEDGANEGCDAGARPTSALLEHKWKWLAAAYGDAILVSKSMPLPSDASLTVASPHRVWSLAQCSKEFTAWARIQPSLSAIESKAASVCATVRGHTSAAVGKNKTVTNKSLKEEERLERSANRTKRSVIESYLESGDLNMEEVRKSQSSDAWCQAAISLMSTGTIPTPMSSDAMHHAAQVTRELPHLHLADDGLLYRVAPADSSKPLDTNKYRLYVPHDMRELFTYAYHDRMGHPGQAKTLKLMKPRLFWPGMDAFVVNHIRGCRKCLQSKSMRTANDRHRATFGAYPFDEVHVDVKTMPKSHDGFSKLLIFVDSLSRWVEAVPFEKDPTSEQVLDAFISRIALRYGWPRSLRNDGGSNLANKLAEQIHKASGTKPNQGSKYHPESQGIVERFQKTLTEMSRASDEGGNSWTDHLPFLLFTYHATPHRITAQSPSALLYGRELRLPHQLQAPVDESESPNNGSAFAMSAYAQRLNSRLALAWKHAADAVTGAQLRELSATPTENAPVFAVGDRVLYRHYRKSGTLDSNWCGPARIEAVIKEGKYRLTDLPNNIMDPEFGRKLLRPFYTAEDESPLAADEYIVDRILNHRSAKGAGKQYLVKWRQCPISQATWEPRAELMRRCHELIDTYDQTHGSMPPPRKHAAPTVPAKDPLGKAPLHHAPIVDSDDTPSLAQLVKGRWQYGQRFSTKRGWQTRWFPSTHFNRDDLHGVPFENLRQSYLDSIADPIVAAVARIVASGETIEE